VVGGTSCEAKCFHYMHYVPFLSYKLYNFELIQIVPS
jgi:hypothetical protein